jgi:hypothetical protein
VPMGEKGWGGHIEVRRSSRALLGCPQLGTGKSSVSI